MAIGDHSCAALQREEASRAKETQNAQFEEGKRTREGNIGSKSCAQRNEKSDAKFNKQSSDLSAGPAQLRF